MDEYERIFDEELDILRDRVEGRIYERNFEKKQSIKTLLHGCIIGFILSLVGGILLYYFGFV